MNWTGGARPRLLHQHKHRRQPKSKRPHVSFTFDQDVLLTEMLNRYVPDGDKRARLEQMMHRQAVEPSPLSVSSSVSKTESFSSTKMRSVRRELLFEVSAATASTARVSISNIDAVHSLSHNTPEHHSSTDEQDQPIVGSTTEPSNDLDALMMSVEHCHARVDRLEGTLSELVRYLFAEKKQGAFQ